MTAEERNKMFEDNMRLVYWVIRKFYPTFWQDEDLIQVGMIGLLRAVDSYDPEKSSFSHFALACIRNEIRMEFKRRSKWGEPLSIEAPLGGDSDNTFTALDKMPSDETVDVSVMSICERVLNEQEMEIFEFVANGGVLAELARDRNVSKQSLSQIYRKACLKLKLALEEE